MPITSIATAFFADQRALGPEQRAVADEESELDREEERLEDRHDSASENSKRFTAG